MLSLLKESERNIKQQREKIQNERDLALQENFRLRAKHRSLGSTFLNDRNERCEFQRAVRSDAEQKYKQNIKHCEDSLGQVIREGRGGEESKIRQLLWETAPELRDLRRMMLAADVCRDQSLQMAEKRSLRQLERQRALAEAPPADDTEEAEEREAREAKRRYHRELDEQLRFRRVEECPASDQSLRQAIDDMRRQIEEENIREAKAKIEKQKELRSQMLELQKVREGMKLREREREESERLRADEFKKAQELRAAAQEESRRLELEQRTRLQEELSEELELECREKLQWERLRTELAVEEREEKEKRRSLETEERRRRVRADLQSVYDMQMRVKKQGEDLRRKEEELLRERTMKELYEQDRLDLMGVQKRRLKQLEHKRAVEALVEEGRARRARERAREMADHRHQEEEIRSRMVEEERIRFLRDHAPLGYLPKKILKDQQTLEHLGEQFKKFYSRPPALEE